MAILLGAAMAGAQDLGAQGGHSSLAPHSYLAREDFAPRFWSPSTIALVALDGAAKASDSFVTHQNVAAGGQEHDPMLRPFVHTTGVQVAAMGALFGAEIAVAYTLHRRHHRNLARAVLGGAAIMNGWGAAASFKNRGSW